MKLLLSECSFDQEEGYKGFNTGIAALAAYLRREGHEVGLARLARDAAESSFTEALRDAKPDLLGVSVMSYQWEGTRRLVRLAKQACPSLPVVLGGIHVTFHPEQALREPGADFVCIGEGEETIRDLMRVLEGRGGRDPRGIPGLCGRHNGVLFRNGPRPPIRDLDTLPYWDRDLGDYPELLKVPGAVCFYLYTDVPAVAAGRGCPFSCSYCTNEAQLRLYRGLGPYPRVRSVSHLMGELTGLRQRFSPARFEFWDEMFGANRAWMEAFAAAYRRELPDTPYSVMIRPEQTRDDRFMRLLADSGCWLAAMGVETGDEAYREAHLNRRMKNEDLVTAFRRCRDHGIDTHAFCMIGLPFETASQMRRTLELARRLDPDMMYVFVFQPFPGTKLHEVCREQGWLPEGTIEPYWTLRPEMALRQPSHTHEEILEIYQEFRTFQAECEVRASARRAARAQAR